MRGPPPPIPVAEHARDRRGQAPPLRRGPRSPAGFQLPQKSSPHRGEGVAARAATDEGSSSPRTSHRACQRQAGASPAPAQRPKISRRLPAAPKAFPLWGEGVAARAAADEGSSFPRPTHRICQRRARKARPCGETENAPAPSSLHQVAPPRTTLRRLMIIYKEGPSFGGGRQPPSKALCNKADAMLPFCYILLRPLDDFELLRYHTHTGKGSCTFLILVKPLKFKKIALICQI